MSAEPESLVVRYDLSRGKVLEAEPLSCDVVQLVFVRDHGTARSVTCCNGGTCWTGEDVEAWLDRLEGEPGPWPSAEHLLRQLAGFPGVLSGTVRRVWPGGWEAASCEHLLWLRPWLPGGHVPPAVEVRRGGKPR